MTRAVPLAELRLICVGRAGAGPEADLFARYVARLRPRPTLVELADGRGSAAEIKRREADGILAALPAQARLVALDLGGRQVDSEGLARMLAGWLAEPRPLCFVIGGAEGLEARVVARAETTLSLGVMTWPHMLARVMLAEQLWRAQAINAGHPYHRSGRP